MRRARAMPQFAPSGYGDRCHPVENPLRPTAAVWVMTVVDLLVSGRVSTDRYWPRAFDSQASLLSGGDAISAKLPPFRLRQSHPGLTSPRGTQMEKLNVLGAGPYTVSPPPDRAVRGHPASEKWARHGRSISAGSSS
jgi:hypothetical protein